MLIANRLDIPDNCQAILWDMDGVLLDSLGLDVSICNELVHIHFGETLNLSKEFIRSIFAYHPPAFWRIIFEFIEKTYGVSGTEKQYAQILDTYNRARREAVFKVLPGINEILEEVKKVNLKSAVVSNNATEDVKQIISRAGILSYFNFVIGNDLRNLKKKPAPDTYLFAAEMLHADPRRCVVIEDSLMGVEAGGRAGCFTTGVATGGADYDVLERSYWVDRVYLSFHPNSLAIEFGQVTDKKICTPNDFITHMIEHIAWRMGTRIDLYWNNNDLFMLGKMIGEKIKTFDIQNKQGVSLGMIDDGSAEVLIDMCSEHKTEIESVSRIDLKWFMSLRCEQLRSGEPLKKMIEGISEGLKAYIFIRICSVEDPHHTWESVFRAIGIALNHITAKKIDQISYEDCELERGGAQADIRVHARSCTCARVSRITSESRVSITIDFSKHNPTGCRFDVSPTISVSELQYLLTLLTEEAGFSLHLDFVAISLSSSHVVLEDTGIVMGRALKEILVRRMTHSGINGAGSSIRTVEDFHNQPVRVGVSVEGRKFWKIIPFEVSFDDVRKSFIIGQNVCKGLHSEDLDDFIDGLCGGLGCSIIIHLKSQELADAGWRMLFRNLGAALKEVFLPNPFRKGVSPGVKATLA